MDPLDKIVDAQQPARMSRSLVAIPGETIGLQVAFAVDSADDYDRWEADVRITTTAGKGSATLVAQVPCALPAYADHDARYLATTPTSLPDHLRPLGSQSGVRARFLPGYWQSVYLDVAVPNDAQAGRHPVRIEFVGHDGRVGAQVDTAIEIDDTATLDALPEFPHAQWLHADALAAADGVEVWSEAHWRRLDEAMDIMVAHQITVLFTPILTPALDTAVGGERPTAQLVGISENENGYAFDFALLDRWIALAASHGMRQLELAPLFTQWGAGHSPKVIVDSGEGLRQRFGWDTDASGEEYRLFVDAFVRAISAHLDATSWRGRYFFHVSDEPHPEHRDAYRSAVRAVRAATSAPIRDATIDLELVHEGTIAAPIAGLEMLEAFVADGVHDTWAYTSCAHHVDVPNVFIAFTGARTRMIGVLLYLGGASGYLRWGFNFWFSQHARRFVDPRRETDAGLAFPSGDPFLVYPGEHGIETSLRLKHMREAMIDVRLLLALEARTGREVVVSLVHRIAGHMTITEYPSSPELFTELRAAVLAELRAAGAA